MCMKTWMFFMEGLTAILTWSSSFPSCGKFIVFRQSFVTRSARQMTICCVQYCKRHGLVANTVRGSKRLRSEQICSGSGARGRITGAAGSSNAGTHTTSVSFLMAGQLLAISSAKACNLFFSWNKFLALRKNGPIIMIATGGLSLYPMKSVCNFSKTTGSSSQQSARKTIVASVLSRSIASRAAEFLSKVAAGPPHVFNDPK